MRSREAAILCFLPRLCRRALFRRFGFERVPDFLVHGDAELEVLAPRARGLLAGVEEGLAFLCGLGGAEVAQQTLAHRLSFAARVRLVEAYRDEDLRQRSLVGAAAHLRDREAAGERGNGSEGYEKKVEWVIIGAMTGPGSAKKQPKREWIQAIVDDASITGVPVFMKDSLKAVWGDDLIREYPSGIDGGLNG